MQGEDLLAANAVGDAADGNGLTNAAMLAGNDGAFENLNTLTSAFLDAYMHTNGVAHPDLGQLFLHVLAVQCFYQIHFYCPP